MRIAREGIPFVLTPGLLTLVALAIGYWYIAVPLLFLTGFMAFFFRDPERQPPNEPNILVAPADGRVTRVRPMDAGNADSPTVVSIFLSPLDVHINRSPIAGEIRDVTYTRGKFLMATKDEASLVNEQNVLTIQGEAITVVCKQIAGILARRVVCWKSAGDRVALGERIGLIKFSSRTDVVMPPNVAVTVKEGSRVQGGTTVIGRIR